MIFTRSEQELIRMRRAGVIVGEVHELMKQHVRPGITTRELDEIAEDHIRNSGAEPAFKGYGGFPASICSSINHQVVHGIPGNVKLTDGDIISIDTGAQLEGYFSDAAKTYPVGNISSDAQNLIDVTRQSFYEGLKYVREGCRLSDISHAIQTYAESYGFSVVRNYVGHGIGTAMHEEPQIPNFGLPGKGPRLRKGMVLAIEPMINAGSYNVHVLPDGWTVVTDDGSLSAHYEHTVAVTENLPEILTGC
ncbi:type I methionyl aminopeptidase [Tindallia californiensis]|uniref:Methionine aminopeptidase n=1 Tax=Tindallia californiensis TaxID=159292 RepID=A0A1H3QXQ4_9FIRM|nr:type I methionyl aminopeptidase [Tindallia californiensis]SDZ18324.1 methionine aminopeptidase, type I [Tindallia californiensis]